MNYDQRRKLKTLRLEKQKLSHRIDVMVSKDNCDMNRVYLYKMFIGVIEKQRQVIKRN